ncbi:Co2+/Mg2+ efflux protein ApaG [Tenacibaculum geojense]|uniref:Co2+/Mg2+ efflux protein ApaG n=1 Tax=Tenacibaculum geojense TaxID=915352 RepID=A0ABW3JTD1_9FLAO
MFEQITKGIKIAVKSNYNGMILHDGNHYHAFSYLISITNTSKETVQLLKRYWTINDSLHNTEKIEGPGVVGETPIIPPNKQYKYTSNCFLQSTAGSMFGSYKMINIDTNEAFLVRIPKFQLFTTSMLN